MFRKLAEYNNLPACSYCSTTMIRLVCAPAVIADFVPYKSPSTGKIIESRSAQTEDLKRSGKFLYEPGVEKDIARNRIDIEEKTFAPISNAVDNIVRDLVNNGKVEA
jgi:hypothetical protein